MTIFNYIIEVNPGGCTSWIQAPDVSWNKPYGWKMVKKQLPGGLLSSATSNTRDYTVFCKKRSQHQSFIYNKMFQGLVSMDNFKAEWKAGFLTFEYNLPMLESDSQDCQCQDCHWSNEVHVYWIHPDRSYVHFIGIGIWVQAVQHNSSRSNQDQVG